MFPVLPRSWNSQTPRPENHAGAHQNCRSSLKRAWKPMGFPHRSASEAEKKSASFLVNFSPKSSISDGKIRFRWLTGSLHPWGRGAEVGWSGWRSRSLKGRRSFRGPPLGRKFLSQPSDILVMGYRILGIYTYIYIYTHLHLYLYIYISMYLSLYIYIYIHAHTHTLWL